MLSRFNQQREQLVHECVVAYRNLYGVAPNHIELGNWDILSTQRLKLIKEAYETKSQENKK